VLSSKSRLISFSTGLFKGSSFVGFSTVKVRDFPAVIIKVRVMVKVNVEVRFRVYGYGYGYGYSYGYS